MRADDHPEEARRLSTLHALDILDTGAAPAWDRIAELASLICGTPIALVSLVDKERQWFKARVGLGVQETPRELAFCGYAILQTEIFEVVDTMQDPRFSDNALVTGPPDIRSYAGAPIRASNGMPIGTVCAIDRKPHELTAHEKRGLRLLADFAEDLTRQRSAALTLGRHLARDETLRGARGVVNQVSDELLNPMTPIFMQLDRLRRSDVPQEPLDVIERNMYRILDAVREAVDTIAPDQSTD